MYLKCVYARQEVPVRKITWQDCAFSLQDLLNIIFFLTVRGTADGTGIMFLNEAVLGKEHHITMGNGGLKAPPKGFDSIIAKGRKEPGMYRMN